MRGEAGASIASSVSSWAPPHRVLSSPVVRLGRQGWPHFNGVPDLRAVSRHAAKSLGAGGQEHAGAPALTAAGANTHRRGLSETAQFTFPQSWRPTPEVTGSRPRGKTPPASSCLGGPRCLGTWPRHPVWPLWLCCLLRATPLPAALSQGPVTPRAQPHSPRPQPQCSIK